MAKRTAIIDIGSNSVRMVIFEKTSRFAFHLLHEVKSRVRISEGAYDNNGDLQSDSIERAISALRDFLSITHSYKVRKTLAVATSAVRDAPNKKLFLKRVEDELGLRIKVIDGEREGYLGGIACANLLPHMQAVTIDIGGGSTECACIDNGKVLNSFSLDIGTVRLKELFFDRDDIEGATQYIDDALKELPAQESAHIIGIGGTYRALARAIMHQSDYPLEKLHGYSVKAKRLIKFAEEILDADEDKLKEMGIKKERFDVIKPGTLIFLRILHHLKADSLTSSGVGVREGVYLADLLRNANHRFPENYNPSMRYLLDKYIIEPEQVERIAQVTKRLFDLLHEDMDIPASFRKELSIAAKLSKIGTSLHYYSYHQHSYYLTQTALEYGYTHEQIMLISTLVRYQKRKRPKKAHREAYETLLPDDHIIEGLSFILALADALLSDHPQRVPFSLTYAKKTISVQSTDRPIYLPQEVVSTLEMPKGISVEFV